jgi:hypothetical protein
MLSACTSTPAPVPRALVFTPTDVAAVSQEPELVRAVAGYPRHYRIDHDGQRPYLTYHEHGQRHRASGDWPAGTSLVLVDVTTPAGTRTYMHVSRYSRFFFTYGNFKGAALYEMRGDDAVEITPLAAMGLLQVQARMPMPGIYIDPTGDLYVMDPNHVIKVVRDGQVIATGDATKLPVSDSGGQPRYLFMFSEGDDRILGVLKPMPHGLDHMPTDADIDTKFKIERPVS